MTYSARTTELENKTRSGLIISGLALLFFGLLAVVITYPIARYPADFAVLSRYSDSLLQAWTLAWDVQALLNGWSLWKANIFYPYPNSLAFSEHLLPSAYLLMPVTLLARTPLTALNIGILLSTVLSGWGTYLLVTWLTGNRWAGIVAGVFFAISPFRMGHLVHFNLLSTHWLPFMFLAAARLIKLNNKRDLLLLIIFTNLQFFSVINYAPMLALSLGVWLGFLLLYYRLLLTRVLLGRLAIFGGVTLALNWPVLHLYRQMSDHMGVVRTLGDARALSASIENYLRPMANSLLYARWMGLPTLLETAFPGLVVVVLAGVGLVLLVLRRDRFLTGVALAMAVIGGIGLILSFGPNDEAFGAAYAPVVGRWLPYPYLYDLVPLFKGFRVPMRFALLVTYALAVLAGLGFALVSQRLAGQWQPLLGVAVVLLIVVEHTPAPLPGQSVPFEAPVYRWLAARPDAKPVLELPFYLHTPQSNLELARVYQSAWHWHPLVNGGSGFKPQWMVELARLYDTFPNWQAFDVARQLGVEYIVLHRNEYSAEAWENITALLPGYLPAVEAVHSIGDDLVLQLAPAACGPAEIDIDAADFPILRLANHSPATWVANPTNVSRVTSAAGRATFLEPLFVAPGQVAQLEAPASVTTDSPGWQLELANAGESLTEQSYADRTTGAVEGQPWQPVEIMFANEAVLRGLAISEAPCLCDVLIVALRWSFAVDAGERVQVDLTDRFGRRAVSQSLRPVISEGTAEMLFELPLADTLPAGRYQLQVQLLSAGDDVVPAIGTGGVTVMEPLALPLIIRPAPVPLAEVTTPLGQLANHTVLLGADDITPGLSAGDWLRFRLFWQAAAAVDGDYTVFTQLIGPDGQVWAQQDNQPRGGWYPTSLWQAQEVVPDDYALRLNPDAPAGRFRLIVGMYRPETGQRVLTTDGADFVEVTTVDVKQPDK
jgi:hypothetical protein